MSPIPIAIAASDGTAPQEQIQTELEPEPAVEMAPIERKKKSLVDHTRLMQAKRRAFEEELNASADELHELKVHKAKVTEMAERSETWIRRICDAAFSALQQTTLI
jgi:CRISPR/Cas system CMR-associated protein Cmr5 small subunit